MPDNQPGYLKYCLALVMAGLLLLAFRAMRETAPERRIRRDLRALAQHAAKSEGENLVQAAQTLRKLGNAFREDAVVRAPQYLPEIQGRRSITETIAQIRMVFLELELSLRDVNVEISAPDRDRADVTLTVLARGRDSGGQSYRDAHEFRLQLSRNGKRWLIEAAERTAVFD